MASIICAIRGGPHSRPTIQQAIQLAKDTRLPITFLYIVNLDFLAHTSRSRVDTISAEMEQMGEFILLTAQAEAEAQGVTAHGAIRHGQVGDEIVSLCQEEKARYVVIGRPLGQPEEDVFDQDLLAGFRSRVAEEGQAELVVAGESAG